eukprot:870732-Amphidinium_carterae.1
MKGVLVRADAGPGLRVRSFHTQQQDLKQLHQIWQQQLRAGQANEFAQKYICLLYTSPSPRDRG